MTVPTELPVEDTAVEEQEQPLIAVAVMAFDEAEVLPRCLGSIKEHFGDLAEIHVSVDDKTMDNSAMVAQHFTDHVYQHKGIPVQPVQEPMETPSIHSLNSMSRMRNDVLDQIEQNSACEWIMWLDADEWWDSGEEELIKQIRRARAGEITPPPQGFMVRMVDQTPSDPLGEVEFTADGKAIRTVKTRVDSHSWREWSNTKIMRRGERFQFRRHEGLTNVTLQVLVPATINHCKVENKVHQQLRMNQKMNINAFLADWIEFGTVRAAYYCMDCYNAVGDLLSAEIWGTRAMELSRVGDPQGAQAAVKLTEVRYKLGDAVGAREAALRSIQLDWTRGDAMFDLGILAANRGKLDEAKMWFTFAAEYKGCISFQEVNTAKVTDMPLFRLAQILEREGNYEEAFERLEEARAFGINRPEFHELGLRLDDIRAKGFSTEPLERSKEGPVIISGGMRTGTTWFCRTLNRLGRMVNEPVVMGERNWYDREEATAEGPACSKEFAGLCEAVAPALRPKRGNFTLEETESLVNLYAQVLEEWPEALGFKDALPQICAQAYPNAQFIILERKTESVLASIQKRWGIGPDISQMRESYPEVWDALLPEDFTNMESEVQRKVEQAIYNVMLQWLDRKELAELGFTEEAGNVRFVQFEDLTANYQHVVPELLEWLGYDVQEAYDRVLPALRAPLNRPAEPVEERRLFKAIAEDIERRASDVLWKEEWMHACA